MNGHCSCAPSSPLWARRVKNVALQPIDVFVYAFGRSLCICAQRKGGIPPCIGYIVPAAPTHDSVANSSFVALLWYFQKAMGLQTA